MFKIINKETNELLPEDFPDEKTANKFRISIPNFDRFKVIQFVPLGEISSQKGKGTRRSSRHSSKVNWITGPKERLCKVEGKYFDGNVRYKPSKAHKNRVYINSGSSKMRRVWCKEEKRLNNLFDYVGIVR